MWVLVRNKVAKWLPNIHLWNCYVIAARPSLLEHLNVILTLATCVETLLFLELKALLSLFPAVREVLVFPNFAFATA